MICEHLNELGWSIYCSADFQASANFKYSFSRREKTPVHFVGAFDTVSSFGLMTNFKTLPYTRHNPSVAHVRHAVARHENRACFKPNLFSEKIQDLAEVWFPGSHCDVGGGYPENGSGLAKVALLWMLNHAQEFGCRFQPDQVTFFLGQSESKYFQCKPDPYALAHHSIVGFWHLVEFLPRRQWNHDKEPEGMAWYWPNLYRRRKIPKNAVLFKSEENG